MMINCPNCNLLQPKDQYCAQCGVNMETWQPPQAPFWKKLLSNWMVQLGLLFLLILGVVMWDSIANRTPKTQSSLPPVAQNIERSSSDLAASSASPTPEPSAISGVRAKKLEAAQKPFNSAQNFQAEEGEKFSSQLKFSMATIPLNSLEGLMQNTVALDENTFFLGESKAPLKTYRKDIKNYGSTRGQTMELGQSVELFFGEQDQLTGKNIGFFLQGILTEGRSPNTLTLELQYWHHIASTEEASDPLSVEVSIPRQAQYILIVVPYAGTREFSRADLSLFEASPRLKGLASEGFMDGSAEIVYLVQIK